MNKTKIEWTDATWNPIRGCSRVSEGCRNCYAEKVAYRFRGPGQPYEGLATKVNGHAAWTGEVRFIEKHLLDPLRWKEPRRIFVNSMSDLFHENVPDEWIDRIFAVMALCPQHQFQVLTKRPARMSEYLGRACGRIADLVMKMRADRGDRGCVGPLPNLPPGATWWPLANVWLGVSVENQAAADERIPLLLETPAAVRFISAEPLLGPVNLNRIEVMEGEVDRSDPENPIVSGYCIDAMSGEAFDDEYGSLSTAPDGEVPLERGIDWVIVGGESGPGARPMHPDWARSLRDQCQAAGVPFFFKQWGEWGPNWLNDENGKVPDSEWMDRMGKKAAGALLDGREWREFPA